MRKKAKDLIFISQINRDGSDSCPTIMAWENGKCILMDFEAGTSDIYDNAEIMQYTGLKDMNGKEIYEGDIFCELSLQIGVMWCVFENGNFVLYHKYASWGLLSRCFDADIEKIYKIEIIGNVHENSDLIKK